MVDLQNGETKGVAKGGLRAQPPSSNFKDKFSGLIKETTYVINALQLQLEPPPKFFYGYALGVTPEWRA